MSGREDERICDCGGERVRSEDVSKEERVYLLSISPSWEVQCAVQRVSECVLIHTFYALPTQSYTSRRFGIRQQPQAVVLGVHLYCCHH
jgi:hypothetical protein